MTAPPSRREPSLACLTCYTHYELSVRGRWASLLAATLSHRRCAARGPQVMPLVVSMHQQDYEALRDFFFPDNSRTKDRDAAAPAPVALRPRNPLARDKSGDKT